HEVIVEKWRPQRELCLLKRQDSIVIPGALLERCEGNGMALKAACKSLSRLIHVPKKLRMEQPRNRLLGLESANLTEDFSPVISRHPYGSDSARFFVDVKVG